MNTFASHPGQVTIFKGLSLALMAPSTFHQPFPRSIALTSSGSWPDSHWKPTHFVALITQFVKAEPALLKTGRRNKA
jgi:hypothetical protein